MQGQNFIVEAIGVVAAAVVQFADRIAAMLRVVEAVSPRRWCAMIGKGVVPIADPMNVSARGEASAARHADRTIAVSALEQSSFRRQLVQHRRADETIAVGSKNAPAVFIGHDEEYVASRCVWHSWFP